MAKNWKIVIWFCLVEHGKVIYCVHSTNGENNCKEQDIAVITFQVYHTRNAFFSPRGSGLSMSCCGVDQKPCSRACLYNTYKFFLNSWTAGDLRKFPMASHNLSDIENLFIALGFYNCQIGMFWRRILKF